ncbi:hypothetical protein BT96DRAFT_1007887 [Gymnopus androsaceus JB14]|uniref:Uncharacterized protein n=1 Tax=Gymnopus androsaceus JB14 TaxID=1447944 RepID=A0A6A4GGJ3_9AGAR|nr:hypothetical protein BT96DRAFT_1007887 [Gymnopus androsaceus JB14]
MNRSHPGIDPSRLPPVHRSTQNGSEAYQTPVSAPIHTAVPRQPAISPSTIFPGSQMGSGPGRAPYIQNNLSLPLFPSLSQSISNSFRKAVPIVRNFLHSSSSQNVVSPHSQIPYTAPPPTPLPISTVTAPLHPSYVPNVIAPMISRPLPPSRSAPLRPPTASERLRSCASIAQIRSQTVVSRPDDSISSWSFSSNASEPMSLTSFVLSLAPYIHLPYNSMYNYLQQPHDHQDPQAPIRPPSVVAPATHAPILHPRPYQPYATAQLVALGEDAVIASHFDQCLVPGPSVVCPPTVAVPGHPVLQMT